MNLSQEELPQFVGQGTYGCVFSPPPRCLSDGYQTFDKEHIAKIFFDDSEMKEEMKIYEKIVQNVDPEHKFTPRLVMRCMTDHMSILEDQKDLCKNSIKSKFQLVMENKGMDWKQFLESNVFRKKRLAVLFRNAFAVADGVRRMHDMNFVHNDIKPANLLFDPKTNQVHLIDFGVAVRKSSIYNVSQLDFHCHNYLFYPPEFSFICNIREYEAFREEFKPSRKNTPFDHLIQKIIPHRIPVENTRVFVHLSNALSSHIDSSELAELLQGLRHKPRTHQFREFLDRWNETYDGIKTRYPNKTHATIVRDIIRRLNLKDYVDVYMLGSTFLFMLVSALEQEIDTQTKLLGLKKHAKLYIGILRLISQSVHANPLRRIPIHSFVGQYRNLLRSTGNLS